VSKVHVAVGVIIDTDRQILISKRPDNVHQGGKWEFPGGKVENGESVTDALRRELFEELDIKVIDCEPLCQISHDYGDKSVLLDTYVITKFSGIPTGKELQPVAKYSIDGLKCLDFPAANVSILQQLEDWFMRKGWLTDHGCKEK
jgi:8-oxo-dGTP diphosphatase